MKKLFLKTKNYQPAYRTGRLKTDKGFTIIEMLVVTAIFAVLTGVIIFKYGDFNSNILVTNMAYEVAITARQAQIFGISARGFEDTLGTNEFSFPYGIFFNLSDGSTGVNEETKKFTLFVDRSPANSTGWGQCNPDGPSGGGGDCSCTPGSETDECIEQLTMTQGVRITELRVNEDASCNSTNLFKAAVTFKRPSPEARIENQSNSSEDSFEFLQIKVEGRSSKVKPAYVLIRKTGQISVSQTDHCLI